MCPMIEHYKTALAGLPKKSVTIKKYSSSVYNPATGRYGSSETDYTSITCRVSKYKSDEIASGAGLIKLQDKKFIFIYEDFPVLLNDEFKVEYDGVVYDALSSTMDVTESVIFVQGRA